MSTGAGPGRRGLINGAGGGSGSFALQLAKRAGEVPPLAERCLKGEVEIHVDSTFGLGEVPEALAHVGEGRALGKVVIEPS